MQAMNCAGIAASSVAPGEEGVKIIPSFNQRLHVLVDGLSGLINRQYSLLERLAGPEPANPEDQCKEPPASNAFQETDRLLRDLQNMVGRAHDLQSKLDRLG